MLKKTNLKTSTLIDYIINLKRTLIFQIYCIRLIIIIGT